MTDFDIYQNRYSLRLELMDTFFTLIDLVL